MGIFRLVHQLISEYLFFFCGDIYSFPHRLSPLKEKSVFPAWNQVVQMCKDFFV